MNDKVKYTLAQMMGRSSSSSKYIKFEDPEVERVLMSNGVGDGIGITEEDMAAVTDIGTWFKYNDKVEYFDELKYTSVKRIQAYAFEDTNLKSISFPSGCLLGGNTTLPNGKPMYPYLEHVEFMDGFVEIGSCCLVHSDFLEYAIIPNGCIIRRNNFSSIYGRDSTPNYRCKFIILKDGNKSSNLGDNLFINYKALKIVDIGNITGYSSADFRGWTRSSEEVNLVLRTFPYSIRSQPDYAPRRVFVNDIDQYKQFSVWSDIVYPIGGEEWQAEMQQLAEEEGYNKPDNIGWNYEYIDYLIYGVEPPED